MKAGVVALSIVCFMKTYWGGDRNGGVIYSLFHGTCWDGGRNICVIYSLFHESEGDEGRSLNSLSRSFEILGSLYSGIIKTHRTRNGQIGRYEHNIYW